MSGSARGLVIGKFYPPHLGHKHLIDTALAQVEHLDVLVCEHPSQKISGQQRVAWLKQMCPAANVRVVTDFGDDDNSRRWADYTREVLGYAPDVVFTSEDYGETYARCLGARHVMVDRKRKQVPISATEIRRSPLDHLEYLSPCVRAHYVRRVCLVGAESTGKTTLAQQLAEHYRTVWVPEYGREYTEQKMAEAGEMSAILWTTEDFIVIAKRQVEMENTAALNANRVLICDTDPLATSVWHERYVGTRCDAVWQIALGCRYDLYLLTACDIAFAQDGLRDGEHVREWMTERFREVLAERALPWATVSGQGEKRLNSAIQAVDAMLAATHNS